MEFRMANCVWHNMIFSGQRTSSIHKKLEVKYFKIGTRYREIVGENTSQIGYHIITRLNFASKTVHLDWYFNLTFEGHPRSKIFSPFESPYMPSYLTSIGTFSLSRTVFEIIDFKVFRVWPWPLTLRGHLRSNICSLFESPYMTSYLTSIDTFSLSRNVFEIFDFKVFRVWPWPLTFGVTLGQKYVHHSKAHICLPILLLLALYLYLVPFLRYSTSKFLGFDLELWPLGVTWGQKYFHHSKAHICLPILLLLALSLYLVPFSRYSTSKFLGFDLDFWPLGVTWGQTYFHHLKAHLWLPI